MATMHGTCDERFSGVRDLLSNNIDSGEDVGSSACVILDGEVVVDLWGGDITDVDGNEKQWAEDTLINVYSTTKTMCNLSALVCADRGLIDLDAPVATYWPEFEANGKENVLVRHLLGHTSGLSGFEEPLAADDLEFADDEIGPALSYERLKALTLGHLGGSPGTDDIAVFNRLTGATMATHLTLVKPGDVVIGVSESHSHPSVVRAAGQAGARFIDTAGLAAFRDAITTERLTALAGG